MLFYAASHPPPSSVLSDPKVSVLVPCFRSERFLATALDSVRAQTLASWECVVVDNASPDGTFALAERYAAQDPRIRAHRNAENLGPVRNWRRCAELAGETQYAALLFSDDWYEPAFLERAVALLDADPGVGIVYSAVRLAPAPDAPKAVGPARVMYALDGPAVRPAADYLEIAYDARGRQVPRSPCCAVARRADLARWLSLALPGEERLGYLRHGAGPDQAVYLQAALEYPRLGHLAEPLVCFSAHGGNLTWRPDVELGYASVLAHFYEAHAARMPFGRARVPAKLASRLIELGAVDEGRRLRNRLGPLGWVMYAKEARNRRRRARRRLTP